MTSEWAIDLARQALWTTLLLAGPPLLAALAVGLLVGALQAATQLHDSVVNLVPRLVAGGLAVAATLPWMLARWLDYAIAVARSSSSWNG